MQFDMYLDRMQEDRECIYYMSGDSRALEGLMLSDRLDEPKLQKLADYGVREVEVHVNW